MVREHQEATIIEAIPDSGFHRDCPKDDTVLQVRMELGTKEILGNPPQVPELEVLRHQPLSPKLWVAQQCPPREIRLWSDAGCCCGCSPQHTVEPHL